MKKHHLLKRFIASFMVVVMTLTAVPMSGFVGLKLPEWSEMYTAKASAASEGYYTYTVSGDEVTITGCDTSISGDVVIPDTIGGYPVTVIDSWAFEYCDGITNVTIPDSVTKIGYGAFYGCDNLISVTIGKGVTSIANNAFSGCTRLMSINVNKDNEYYSNQKGVLFDNIKTKIIRYPNGKSNKDYEIPESVTEISNNAFDGCINLTNLIMPDSVKWIGDSAFCGCDGLTSIAIGKGVTSIADNAFNGCTRLISINVDEDNEYYSNQEGVLFNKSKTQLIRYPIGKSNKDYEIPKSVTEIDDNAFDGCINLTNLIIPDSVTWIGDRAFGNCSSLTSITIPNSVARIGYSAFGGCTKLSSILIGNSITSIGDSTFENCTSLMSVIIPDSVTSIGEYAFSNCTSLTSAIIPDCVTSMGNSVFEDCSDLTNIIIGSSVAGIGNSTFENCTSLMSVIIPDSVTWIGDRAFGNCSSLTSITIPNSVARIGYSAFGGCTKLSSISIGNSVTSIGEYAFSDCISLIDVNISDLTTWCKISFLDNYSNPFIYAKNLYINGKPASKIIIPNSVTKINDYAFYNCTNLISVAISDSVTSIGDCAFENCSSLTSVTIPGSVTSIGDWAFENCSSLTSVTIPDSVTSIGDWAFEKCSSLTSITIPDSVTSIGDCAFENCSSLTSVTIPDSVTSMGGSAFYDCTSLKNIKIGSGIIDIDGLMFKGCTNLTSITIPDSVISIGYFAFTDTAWYKMQPDGDVYAGKVYYRYKGTMPENTKVVIKNGTNAIAEGAFFDCTGLISVVIPDSVINIGPAAFSRTGLTNIIIPDGVRLIGIGTFYESINLTSIIIPDSVEYIGQDAFSGTSWYNIQPNGDVYAGKLYYQYKGIMPDNTSIVIKDGTKGIADSAFEDCTGLISITIPSSVIYIGNYAFKNCTSLISITIPNSVTYIGTSIFENCSDLVSVKIGNGVTSISSSMFENCESLTSIVIPNGVTCIDVSAFRSCTSLTIITLPNGVTNIESSAFKDCTNLISIMIPYSVTKIGYEAFANCINLNDVFYTGDESNWNRTLIDSKNLGNKDLLNATIHYNYTNSSDNNGSSGKSENTQSNSSTNKPLVMDCLRITPYAQNSESLISLGSMNSTVIWGTKSKTTSENETSVLVPKTEINGPIRITEENHRDYIIPSKIAGDLSQLKATVSFPVYMTKKNSKSYYISSVIGKKDHEDASKYVDLKYSPIECISGERVTIYVTTCGLTNPTYYLSQDNAKKISSTTGEFSSVDVYNKFDFDGVIVAYAVDSDGKKTEPVKIKLSKKIKMSNSAQALNEMTTMNLLGSSAKGFSINEDFPILGGTTIDFSAFEVPVGVEINGTDVKISLGFDFFENKKNYETGEWEKEWKGFKDNCKSTEKTLNDLDDAYENWQKKWNSLENLKKQYSGKNVFKTGTADKDKGWTCSFLGYIEAKLTEDGKICFKEGSIMASAEFKFKYSQQTAVWAIPAYYYFELGAEVSLDGKVYKLVPDRTCPVDWAVTLGVEPKVAVGGGAGIVDFASVGLRGEGSAPIKLEFTKGHLTIDLKGALYAEGQLLFIKGKKKIIDGTLSVLDRNLWGTKRAKQILSLRREAAVYDATDSETVLTVMDRDYAQNTSSWLGSSSGVRRAPARAAATGGIRFTNLQTSVYNQSQPQVVTVGDKQIMVYVADDSTRDDYNRLCLMYSVNENGTWSTPKAVYSDGNNDASPSLATDGEKVYVSWQKVAKKLTAADCESEQVMLQNMEIYLAEFNAQTGSFENAKRLTNNSVYDYLPFTVVENEKASVYFAEGDPAGYTNKIVRYSDGSTATLKSSLPYVSALSAVSDAVSYSIDTDVTNGLTNDMTVYTVKDGHVSAFEKYVSEEADTTENAYNLLTYGEMDGKQTLFVSDGSSVYYQKDGKTQKAFSAVSSVSGYLQAVKTDTGLTLLWLGYTDDSTEIFSCSYENGAWSEPVQVSSQGNIISFLSANYAGGTIRGVCNITENQFNESAGDYDIGQTNLTSFVIGDFTDLSVSAFAPDETELKPGAETVINCYVTQKGTEDISSLDITVTDILGTNVNYQQDVELKSGSTINLEIPYTVPQDYKGTTITVQVNADNSDKDESDNTVALETGKNTILLNDRPIEEFDDVYILPLSVENYTALDIENLTLTYSIENYDENTDNESVTLKLDSLTEDSYNDVRIAVKKDGLVYDEDGFARINIAVYDGEDEISSLVSVIENPDQECRHAVTEETAEVPATCLESGKSASVKCSVCGEILSGGEEIPALGHNEVIDEATPATCTETGLTEGKHCLRCGETLAEQEIVPAKGHHEVSANNGIAPTCTTYGKESDLVCSVCGVMLQEGVKIPASGHTPGEWIVDKNSNCTTGGTKHQACSICGTTIDTAEIPMKGHQYKSVVTKPTCTAEGYTSHTCSTCGDTYSDSDIPALGHSFTNYVSDNNATCTQDGTKTAKCDRCDVTYTVIDEGSTKGHTPGAWIVDKDSDCVNGGSKHQICSVCGKKMKTEDIPAKGHKYVAAVTTPTCTADGYTMHTCSVCSDTYTDSTVPALGHSFTNYVSDNNSTCTQDGTKTAKCDRCDVTDTVVDEGSAKGHTPGDWIVDKNSDCTTGGTKHQLCSVCGTTIDTAEIPMKGHQYKSVVTKPTCTTDGYTIHTCSVCGNTYTDSVVKATGHKYESTITKATTAKDGKIVTACTICGKISKTVVIPKIASTSLSSASYTYDGKVKSPTVTVKNSKGTTLKNGTDYTVTYASGRKTPGQYAVKIIFKGNYSGSKTLYFTILPGVTSKIATATNSSTVKIAWKAVPGATGYRVYQYDTKTKKYVTLKTTTGTSYTVTKLKSGTNYKFAVRAYSTVNGKVYWASGYKTITATTNPGTPTLKVTAGSKKATLSWNKQTGATGYVVYMATSKNGKYSKIATLKGNSSVTYTKTGLTKGKTYYFKVAAYTVSNGKTLYSSFSSVKAVKIK